jgi:hypothetical protein
VPGFLVLGWIAAAGAAAPDLLASDSVLAWGAFHDARLVESVDGLPDAAVRAYRQILRNLPEGDPLRGTVLCALGEATWALGDEEGARDAFLEALQVPSARPRAGELLAQQALARVAVRKLPARVMAAVPLTPSSATTAPGEALRRGAGPPPPPDPAWVRAGEFADRGAVTNTTKDGLALLAWDTRVEGRPDRLSLAIAEGVSITRGSLRVRSARLDARLVVRLLDGGGQAWEAAEVAVPAGRWVSVELAPAALRAARGRVRLLEIVDLTGESTDLRGQNTLHLDALELR